MARKKHVWYPHVRTWSFGSKCAVVKKVLVTLFGLFGAQEILLPLPPLVMPLMILMSKNIFLQLFQSRVTIRTDTKFTGTGPELGC